jgi:uncharacterized protein
MKRLVLACIVIIHAYVTPLLAGPYQDGQAAYERGDYTSALREFKILADKGNAKAQHSLGKMYLSGQGVKMNWPEAIKWLRKAAKQGLGEAQAILNSMNIEGEVTPPQGWVKYEKIYLEAAAQGDAEAQFQLGKNYYYGWTVQRNDEEAAGLFRLAAKQGHPFAQYFLGLMYFSGEGVPKDRKTAAIWLLKSTEQGLPEGSSLLGFMYEKGDGVRLDLAEAYFWYLLNGNLLSMDSLGNRLALLQYRAVQERIFSWGDDLSRKNDLLVDLWLPLAEKGIAEAQYEIGYLYTHGRGVPLDKDKAARWVRKSADQGYAPAQGFLGDLYTFGRGVRKDYVEAAKWRRKASEQGNKEAQYQLGHNYLNGIGVTQDYVLAHMWFNILAAQGVEDGRRERDNVSKKMTPSQIAEAQKLAREWKPNKGVSTK